MPLFVNEDKHVLIGTNLKVAFTSLRHTPSVRRMAYAEMVLREAVGILPKTRVFLVRNPYDRLVSFYEDKLKTQPQSYGEKSFYWERCQLPLGPYLGVDFRKPKDEVASRLTGTAFPDLIEAICAFAKAKAVSRLDGHLRPQTVLVERLRITAPRRKWSLAPIEDQGSLLKAVGAKLPKMNATSKGPTLQGMAVEEGKDLLISWGIESRPFILMHAESRDPRKCVPTAKWGELLEILSRSKPELVAILVGVARSGANADVSELLKSSGVTLVDAVGQTSFRAVAQLCALASGAICVDSVVSHLSIAFEKPTLVLLGSGSSNRLAYPADNVDLPLFIVETTRVTEGDIRDVSHKFALSVHVHAQKRYETSGSS
jgi:hypothetical protein